MAGRPRKPETKKIRTSIQLSPTQRKAIKALAKHHGLSESKVIRLAIDNYAQSWIYGYAEGVLPSEKNAIKTGDTN
jgi:predicted DNA-binding protein